LFWIMAVAVALTRDRRFRGYVTEAPLALEASKQRDVGDADIVGG
jgi:hypothetical protein